MSNEDHAVETASVKERKNALSREWYRANKERSKQIKRRWVVANPEKTKAAKLAWNTANHERVLECRRARRAITKVGKTLTDRRWRANNKEKIRSQISSWRKTEKGSASGRHSHAIRKARKKKCVTTCTAKEIVGFLRRAKRCYYCGTRFNKSVQKTVDHVIPISKGGAHSLHNLCAACPSCNSKKKDKPPEVFAAQIGRLLI